MKYKANYGPAYLLNPITFDWFSIDDFDPDAFKNSPSYDLKGKETLIVVLDRQPVLVRLDLTNQLVLNLQLSDFQHKALFLLIWNIGLSILKSEEFYLVL
jgi:hypothetical protein